MTETLKKVILLVDDDPAILNAFKQLFGQKYDLVFAESAEDALHIFKQKEEFNLIILDYRLPDMDGIALFKKI
ncbi:response regulator, partial [Nitrospira defluvii]|nr:response regulator [Nitrospira defluvii]